MAFSLKTSGSWAETTTDPQSCALVGTPAAGDRYFLWVAWKDYSTTCTVSGWDKVTEYADGTVSAGSNIGSVKVACWTRDWVSGDGAPSIDWSAAPVPAVYVMQLWQKAAADTWEYPIYAVAAHASSAGPVTRSAGTALDVTAGAAVFALWGIRDDSATFTRGATDIDKAAPDLTWVGNYVESPATHISTTTSNDISADLGYRLVTTGADGVTLRSSIQALSAAETGAILWVVQNAPVGVGVGRKSVNTVTKSFTTVAGNTLLVVAVAVGHSNQGSYSTWTTRTATHNAKSMTSLGAVNSNNSTWGWVELFYILNPDIGTCDIVVNMTKTGVTDYSLIVGAKAYSGPTSVGTPVTNYGSSTAPTVTVASNSAQTVVAAIVHSQQLSALSDNTVFRCNFNSGATSGGNLAIIDQVGEASSVLSATGRTSDSWAAIGVALISTAAYEGSVTETVTATITPGAGKGTNIGVTQTVTAAITPALTLGHAYTGAVTRTTTATVTPAAKTNQNAGVTEPITVTITPVLRLGYAAGAAEPAIADIGPALRLGYAAGLTQTATATVTPGAKTNQNAGVTQAVTATISAAASVKTNWTAGLTETVTATIAPAAAIDQDIGTTTAVAATVEPAATIGHQLTGDITESTTATIDLDASAGLNATLTTPVAATISSAGSINQSIDTGVASVADISVEAQVSQVGTSFIQMPVTASIEVGAKADLNADAAVTGAADIDLILVRGLAAQISAATIATVEPNALTGHAHSASVTESVNADIATDARADLGGAVTEAITAVLAASARTDQRIATSIAASAEIDVSASVSAPGAADIALDATADIELTARVASETGITTAVIATIGISANVTKNTAIQSPITAAVSVAAVVDARAAITTPIAATVSIDSTKHADLTAAVAAAAAISIDATVANLGALLDIAHRYTVTIATVQGITIMADIITIPIRVDSSVVSVNINPTDLETPEIPICLDA